MELADVPLNGEVCALRVGCGRCRMCARARPFALDRVEEYAVEWELGAVWNWIICIRPLRAGAFHLEDTRLTWRKEPARPLHTKQSGYGPSQGRTLELQWCPNKSIGSRTLSQALLSQVEHNLTVQ